MILKKFKLFESSDDIIQFGVTVDDLEFYFTDFIDNDYNLRIYPSSVLIDMRNKEEDNLFKLGIINYISVEIWKKSVRNKHNYRSIIETPEFKEIIDESNDRLKDHGLFIKDVIPYGYRISILIYREIDKKYLQLK